ncbi:type IV pilus assembly protein FimV [Ideonella sp. YS5]|uniref:type IV pilus assembly protein FimV n=1 Tax=Ideonella sp. YS5 TaxID=3453714 RepID=UPI003EEBC092
MPPRATALILACAASATTPVAQAIGFGRVSGSVVLGQSLDLPVPLHLDPGERLGPECVSAEVAAGESRFGQDQVRVRLEPSKATGATESDWIARITTRSAIVEPVIEVSLTVGCERRFSRRFTAFADPPSSNAPAVATQPSRAPGAVPLVAAEGGETAEAPALARAPRNATPASQRRPARTAAAPSTPSAPRARARAAAQSPVVGRQAPAAGNRLLLEPSAPRLKLDLEDPVFMPPVRVGDPEATASAAGGSAESPAAAADAGRVQALEKSLADLRREGAADRERAAALQVRLGEAERRERAVPWLASVLALALLVAGWLTLRLRRQQAADSARWWTPEAIPSPAPVSSNPPDLQSPHDWRPAEAPAPSGFADLVSEATAPLPVALSIERDGSPQAKTPAEKPYERTTAFGGPPVMVLDPSADGAAVREVSVEELLDLEQQADFFIALGQEDAAIDLLMSHLRSTGGLSPLPYTKLLEIYRRQGDRDAFERIRARFNRRFNAYAPDWEAGPMSGRVLEEYPQAVQELQARWAEPLDAMAVLEAMLFRKDPAYELFDLPAYKDVLLLYAIARDLWQQGGALLPAVDVLLPLGDEPAAHAVGPDTQHGLA